jgi:segregation and condensation protein B
MYNIKMKNLNTLIEAFLFWKNEPVSLKKLANVFGVSEEEIKKELVALKENISERGIILMEKDDEVALAVSPEANELIEKLTKEELSKELSKAALETLSIVLYKGPVRRSEIDYIRGVNSQFILRHLEIRGLVEKIQSEQDARAYLYRPTFNLLSHIGLQKIEDLPEFEALRQAVENFKDEGAEVIEENINNENIQTSSEVENTENQETHQE